METLVSIIIPCFNSERWISAAINSALSQTWSPKEVIVVDDGSNDSSYSVIKEFGNLIRSETRAHKGVCAARNRGMELAQGEWIQFLDADDILHPERIELLLQVSHRYSEGEFVWAENEQFHGNNLPSNFSNSYLGTEVPGALSTVALEAAYAPWAAIFRKDFLQYVGTWNETLTRWVDLEYHARIARTCHSYVKVQLPLYGYRQHSDGRISDANHNGTNVEAALNSLRCTEEALTCESIPSGERDACLFPFYIQLAQAAGFNGDKINFLHCLKQASSLSHRCAFHWKAKMARICSKFLGVKTTSRLIGLALQQHRRIL